MHLLPVFSAPILRCLQRVLAAVIAGPGSRYCSVCRGAVCVHCGGALRGCGVLVLRPDPFLFLSIHGFFLQVRHL